MLHLAAIILLVIAVILYAMSVAHGVIGWQLFMLLGLAAWCIAGHPKVP